MKRKFQKVKIFADVAGQNFKNWNSDCHALKKPALQRDIFSDMPSEPHETPSFAKKMLQRLRLWLKSI